MERGSRFPKEEREWAREREGQRDWFDLTRNTDLTCDLDRDGSRDSGHLTGRAWYRFETWKLAVILQPSLSSENDWNAAVWSSKIHSQKPITIAVNFAGVWARLQLGSTPHVISIIFWPTLSPETAGLSTIGHLESSRFWEHDPPPSLCVEGHRGHHWTHRCLNYQTWASHRRWLKSGHRRPVGAIR